MIGVVVTPPIGPREVMVMDEPDSSSRFALPERAALELGAPGRVAIAAASPGGQLAVGGGGLAELTAALLLRGDIVGQRQHRLAAAAAGQRGQGIVEAMLLKILLGQGQMGGVAARPHRERPDRPGRRLQRGRHADGAGGCGDLGLDAGRDLPVDGRRGGKVGLADGTGRE